MKASVLACLILFSSCLFELLHTSDANQAEHLRLLINKSRRSPGSVNVNPWVNLDDEKVSKPVRISSHDGLMEADKIDKLPGQPQGVDFDQYAGYVTVDEKAGRSLFYYFVESPEDPSKKPLVLWLNGGPGCSSLGWGAMVELGPFRVDNDGESLYVNQYAWNIVANVIFLESPAGVGFSYSNTTSDYKLNGDKRTADDTYTFLVNWLERFPQYKARDFYITGESYAGHYVPELASTILSHNQFTNQTIINLKGIAIGNALIDMTTTTTAVYDYLWSHALISDESHQAISSACNFSSDTYTPECLNSLDAVDVGSIDSFNIYGPVCNGSSNKTTTHNEADPCSMDYTTSYLNLPEVQKALHVNVTNLQHPWQNCSRAVGENWLDAPATTLPIIQHLVNNQIRVWLYSGDFDSVVPVTSTKRSVNKLGLPVVTSWRPWYGTATEVGGYVVGYKGLTFATIRGAGHMAPSSQPERALVLFASFLEGILPPFPPDDA